MTTKLLIAQKKCFRGGSVFAKWVKAKKASGVPLNICGANSDVIYYAFPEEPTFLAFSKLEEGYTLITAEEAIQLMEAGEGLMYEIF